MSRARRLRRLAQKAELKPALMSAAAAVHGCALCRGLERRQLLIRDMLNRGEVGDSLAKCGDCGADWKVSLFAVGAEGHLHARFEPVAPEVLN